MTPQASTLTFASDEFPVSPSHAQRIDRAIARYPIVAQEIELPARESFLLRFRKTWLGDFCYEVPGFFQSFFWGLRIAVRMNGRKS